ncbi:MULTISPECIES: DUF3298 domain-containing protein [unclassified Mycobacterium]|uniref:DUF3298 domain-containing protein n=1 Tax=unclassified Mycobacterium TaxID=2642494 RepID=UPI0029C73FE8|nr:MULTISPECIES: DUF3298 domain-containing protein [unclassified Mycobacterium]
MKIIRCVMLMTAAMVPIALSSVNSAWAEPAANEQTYVAVPAMITGNSPDSLGTWTVHYERVDGGNPDVAAAVNDGIDAEANRQVRQNTWEGSKKHQWTFDATGTVHFYAGTISELFVGGYDADERNVRRDTVTSAVFDGRTGTPITWDNLFRDKGAGLARLSEQTAAILPTVYTPVHPDEWKRYGQLAPVDINFKYWIPTAQGIELHFPDYQFGRGIKVITVPWANIEDLIAPEFVPIVGRGM